MFARLPRRFSFAAKLAGLAALMACADILLFRSAGPAPGIFALAWAGMLLLVLGPVRRRVGALVSLCAALLFALVLIDAPSLLAWVMFWTALSLAALLPRHRFDDAARWAQRLVMHGALGLATPFRDAWTLRLIKRSDDRAGIRAVGKVVALPLLGSALFLALFTWANPLIADTFAQLDLPNGMTAVLHALLWIGVSLLVWPSLRPFPAARRFGKRAAERRPILPDVPLGTLTLSLCCFNAVFALQNALDLTFLWSGARLPGTVTLADYAHRGAYTLIATAILAGLFVLLALRPGSAGAQSPMVRRLLVLWVAQNLMLVASSVLRLIDYIEAYSLTVWRISALAWMGLVGMGLVLICWRLLAGRSAAWLINANALAATVVLSAASVVDLGATAAQWNVAHARTTNDLDLCYLRGLGASALLPLIALERRVSGAALQDQVAFVRQEALDDALWQQRSPWTASLRNARRLDKALAMSGPAAVKPRDAPEGRSCDGSWLPAPPFAVPAPAPAPAPAPPLAPIGIVPPTPPLTPGQER
ncbi:DUF4153 domain-containing protein [Sphingomonas hylomeconis]|uniref:DUF4153 domain-containing protein n=1 Tax=Sphingomonas hylomeconis TaxID=1395958 RepID=A0ABV7SXP7_9SPHN|nr:DUF4173 domain-containing protein [Sphingomonas hylomeconis]